MNKKGEEMNKYLVEVRRKSVSNLQLPTLMPQGDTAIYKFIHGTNGH